MRKKQLIKQNEQLQNRIIELEEIICPARQHDYFKFDEHLKYPDAHTVVRVNYYICKKCKKIKKDYDFI